MDKYLQEYPAVLSIAEVAEILGVAQSTVRKLIKAGKLPAVNVGRLIRIPKKQLVDYLNIA